MNRKLASRPSTSLAILRLRWQSRTPATWRSLHRMCATSIWRSVVFFRWYTCTKKTKQSQGRHIGRDSTANAKRMTTGLKKMTRKTKCWWIVRLGKRNTITEKSSLFASLLSPSSLSSSSSFASFLWSSLFFRFVSSNVVQQQLGVTFLTVGYKTLRFFCLLLPSSSSSFRFSFFLLWCFQNCSYTTHWNSQLFFTHSVFAMPIIVASSFVFVAKTFSHFFLQH